MATFNPSADTNNVNQVVWSWSTRLTYHTDRSVTGAARGAEVQAIDNLGVGVALGDPFTLLT